MPTVSVSKNCPRRNSENCRGKRDLSSSESLGFETRVKSTNKFIGLWEVCTVCTSARPNKKRHAEMDGYDHAEVCVLFFEGLISKKFQSLGLFRTVVDIYLPFNLDN